MRRARLRIRYADSLIALLALALSCGEGREVNLGTVVVEEPHGPGEPPGSEACGSQLCAHFTGSKRFVEPSAADASADAFDDATERPPGSDAAAEPVLLYPSNETLLPINLSRLRFAWLPGQGNLFALDFVGPSTSVRIVTADTSFTATDEEWDWLAESNRGGRVDVVVRCVDAAAPTDAWRSQTVTLYFDESPLEGTAYYWSTGSRGLMQAGANDARATRIFSDPLGPDAAVCTGCHSVSRDGKRLAAGYDKNDLAELALDDLSVIVPLGSVGVSAAPDPMAETDAGAPPPPKGDKPPPMAWSTFSPDGTLLLVAGGGKLRLIDADTGTPIGAEQGLVSLPEGTTATHPDWSPLGDRIAVTLGKGGDKQTEEGTIALLPFADGAFGEPEILVPNAGGKDNDFFPSFSPDGRYVAFVNAPGGSQENAQARLQLVEVATGLVRDLTRVNERVNEADGLSDLGNTMPTWGPVMANGRYWLTFSSLRAYSNLRLADPKRDQLFIAGIDPSLDDPGYAAFWAPFQSMAHGNHRAFWTPVAEARSCSTGDTCAEREICDNGLDDDCDCVIDDCSEELCDDGVDNDGDGKKDEMDLACAP